MKKVWITLLALSLLTIGSVAGAADYVGAKKCKGCHGKKTGDQWGKWESGPHAGAFKKLKPEDQKKAECLECHTTKGDKPEMGVGCEACHGPGSDYKSMKVMKDHEKALAAGMVVPDEAVCKKCHNDKSPTFKGFDFAKSKEKIAHPVK